MKPKHLALAFLLASYGCGPKTNSVDLIEIKERIKFERYSVRPSTHECQSTPIGYMNVHETTHGCSLPADQLVEKEHALAYIESKRFGPAGISVVPSTVEQNLVVDNRTAKYTFSIPKSSILRDLSPDGKKVLLSITEKHKLCVLSTETASMDCYLEPVMESSIISGYPYAIYHPRTHIASARFSGNDIALGLQKGGSPSETYIYSSSLGTFRKP
jgi:hypothetical protein